MTPQAGLPPPLPVFKDSAWPPLPKSSVPAWTTTVLPKIEVGPYNLTNLSVIEPFAKPEASVLMLPKSPTWRFSSDGPPWVLEKGLKCGPAEVQPLVLSPNSWIWKPLSAFESLPEISYEIVVASFSEACSKVTVPETPASPRKTATVWKVLVNNPYR